MKEPSLVELRQLGPNTLGIVWDDGHHSTHNVRNLRLACRCAGCVDEWTRKQKIKPEDIPADIQPKQIETVGRYAVKITWSDGHSTGIYTFQQLRTLCECTKCRA